MVQFAHFLPPLFSLLNTTANFHLDPALPPLTSSAVPPPRPSHTVSTHISLLPSLLGHLLVDNGARRRVEELATDLCKETRADPFGNNGKGELWLVTTLLLKALEKLGHFKVMNVLDLSLTHSIAVHKDTIREAFVQLVVLPQCSYATTIGSTYRSSVSEAHTHTQCIPVMQTFR